jgi:hypothetical protein
MKPNAPILPTYHSIEEKLPEIGGLCRAGRELGHPMLRQCPCHELIDVIRPIPHGAQAIGHSRSAHQVDYGA